MKRERKGNIMVGTLLAGACGLLFAAIAATPMWVAIIWLTPHLFTQTVTKADETTPVPARQQVAEAGKEDLSIIKSESDDRFNRLVNEKVDWTWRKGESNSAHIDRIMDEKIAATLDQWVAETPAAATEQQVAEAEATPVPVPVMPAEPQLPVFETVAGGYGHLPVVTFSAKECASVTATAKINFAGEICTVNIRALPVGTRIVYCKPFVPEPNMAYGATLLSLSAIN